MRKPAPARPSSPKPDAPARNQGQPAERDPLGIQSTRLEELDLRLETSVLPLPGEEILDPCVWACACFLIDGE